MEDRKVSVRTVDIGIATSPANVVDVVNYLRTHPQLSGGWRILIDESQVVHRLSIAANEDAKSSESENILLALYAESVRLLAHKMNGVTVCIRGARHLSHGPTTMTQQVNQIILNLIGAPYVIGKVVIIEAIIDFQNSQNTIENIRAKFLETFKQAVEIDGDEKGGILLNEKRYVLYLTSDGNSVVMRVTPRMLESEARSFMEQRFWYGDMIKFLKSV